MIRFAQRRFSRAVLAVMRRDHLSYRDAAKRCGLSQTTLQRVAHDKRQPALRSAMAIADKLLGCSLQEFTEEI